MFLYIIAHLSHSLVALINIISVFSVRYAAGQTKHLSIEENFLCFIFDHD
jgi:hypothetical protein